MTEFETATLAMQEASLSLAALSAWSTFAYAVVSLLVGGAQCGLLWYGIRMMRRAADARDRTLDAQLRTLDAHTLALQTLVARGGGAAAGDA